MDKLALWRPTYLSIAVMLVSYATIPWLMIVPCTILGLDQLARYGEYQTIVKTGRGVPLFRLRRSWCGRGVGIAAHGDTARGMFNALGYRWWHILPDGFPGIFLDKSFWVSVFYSQEK